MKRLFTILALLALLCVASVPAMAADSEPAEVTAEETDNENAVKIRKAWTSAGLIAVACLGGALGDEQHRRAARGGGADPHLDDDWPCVHRNGHHLRAHRGDPYYICPVMQKSIIQP